MSRSGYSDDCGGWELNLWRGAVESSIRGKRGQQFLKDMLAALDAMPSKRLIAGELKTPAGEVCALGSVGVARDKDMKDVALECRDSVGEFFGIAPALAAEIQFINDDDFSYRTETPEERFKRVRQWVVDQIKVNRTQETR